MTGHTWGQAGVGYLASVQCLTCGVAINRKHSPCIAKPARKPQAYVVTATHNGHVSRLIYDAKYTKPGPGKQPLFF